MSAYALHTANLWFGRNLAHFVNKIKTEFLDCVRKALRAGPINGVCLALHGSMKVEGLGCADGDFAGAVRELLPGAPVTAALDTHATVTEELLAAADGFTAYKTVPHVDCAARMLLKSLEEKIPLYTAYKRIPMLIAGEKSETAAEPMRSLMEYRVNAEREPSIETVSPLLGFPWADDERNAASVLVSYSGGGRRAAAEKTARELAASFWKRRKEFGFRTECYDTPEALARAYRYAEKGERPVFLSDSGDNPTAGTTGDLTDLLEEIIRTFDRAKKLPTPVVYSRFYDAPAAAACVRAGEGAELDITPGGNRDTVNGKKSP